MAQLCLRDKAKHFFAFMMFFFSNLYMYYKLYQMRNFESFTCINLLAYGKCIFLMIHVSAFSGMPLTVFQT